MKAEDRQRRFDMSKLRTFAFGDLFVYAPHGLLPRYIIDPKKGRAETGYYMVDFRRTCRVECATVTRKQPPVGAKVLQLSIDARGVLRDKLADFFGRVPREDEV